MTRAARRCAAERARVLAPLAAPAAPAQRPDACASGQHGCGTAALVWRAVERPGVGREAGRRRAAECYSVVGQEYHFSLLFGF
jgi:hypothetical protein